MPFCTLLLLLAGATDNASAATPAAQTVDDVIAEANRRALAGEPADAVEAWMADAMQRAGVNVTRKPPSWDVYGTARWAQENPEDSDQAGAEARSPLHAASTEAAAVSTPRPAGSSDATRGGAKEF